MLKVVWFTGLPASGKTTLGDRLELELNKLGVNTLRFDGDTFRKEYTNTLGFSTEDRARNISNVVKVLKRYDYLDDIAICSFISPFKVNRDCVRAAFKDRYFEVWCYSPVETCIVRDPKGMYAKAKSGLIPNFTGISSPYEEPDDADLTINTSVLDVHSCIFYILDEVKYRWV